jgi:hypothetical protein
MALLLLTLPGDGNKRVNEGLGRDKLRPSQLSLNSGGKMTEQKVKIPLGEQLKGIPGLFGIRLNEEPEYRVLKKDNHFEIREYPALVLASTDVHEDYDTSKNEAFKRLAGYIFGRNHENKQIPMTAPVLQQEGKMTSLTAPFIEEKKLEDWSMTFILPKGVDFESAPEPQDTRVHLSTRPVEKWASLQYAGNPDEEVMLKKVAELKTWLEKQPHFRAISDARWAQYDSPMTLPFLRRNEVQIQVVPV